MIGLLIIAFTGAVECRAASLPAGSTLTNTATLKYSDGNGNPAGEINASASTIVSGCPILSVTKKASSNPVSSGDTFHYTITYENSGNMAATDVTIRDTLSGYLNYISSSDGGLFAPDSRSGGLVSWSLGDVPAGSSGTVSIQTKVKISSEYPAGDPGTIADGAVISNNVIISSNETTADFSLATIVGRGPKFAISISSNLTRAAPGDEISYSIDFTNTGNLEATDTRVTLNLPDGTALITGSAANLSMEGRTLIWQMGNTVPGGNGHIDFKVSISTAAEDGLTLKTIAAIGCRELLPVSSNEVITTVYRSPLLTISKAGLPNPVQAGGTITYSIRIGNQGNRSVTRLVIKDSLPSGTTLLSYDSAGSIANDEIFWAIPELPPGKTINLSLVVKVPISTPLGTSIVNNVIALSPDANSSTASASNTVGAAVPAAVLFTDSSGNRVHVYQPDEQIWITLFSPQANRNFGQIDLTVVEVTNIDTGDIESLVLTETGPDTGIFRGDITSSEGTVAPGDKVLQVRRDTALRVTYPDPVFIGQTASDTAMIDPVNHVFDSTSGAPLSGVKIAVLDASTGIPANLAAGIPNPVISDSSGKFRFKSLPAGKYILDVTSPTGYSYPSTENAIKEEWGYTLAAGSRKEPFSISSNGQGLNLDVPLDRIRESIVITKEAGRTRVSLGDFLTFLITATNSGSEAVHSARVIDTMPHGMQYVPGSSMLGGKPCGDPAHTGERTLEWPLPDLIQGDTQRLTYTVILSAGTREGNVTNSARITGLFYGRKVVSPTAKFKVKVVGGVFTSRGTIIGKVFIDANGNGFQENSRGTLSNESAKTVPEKNETFFVGEPGLSNVILYLEDGTRVSTDNHGRFSIPGVSHGTHVVRIDETTLPPGTNLINSSSRSGGNPSSQFVEFRYGGMETVNFPVSRPLVTEYAKTGSEKNIPSTSGEGYGRRSGDDSTEEPLEKMVRRLTPEPEFLDPANHGESMASRITVTVKCHSQLLPVLSVNGKKLPDKLIGKKVTEDQSQVAVYQFVNVELTRGIENLLEFKAIDSFGNCRGESSAMVYCFGMPASITAEPEIPRIPADGVGPAEIALVVSDQTGRAVLDAPFITVDCGSVEILSEDCDPVNDGIQVECHQGRAILLIRPPTQSGRAELSAFCSGVSAKIRINFVPHMKRLLINGLGDLRIGKGQTRGAFSPMLEQDWFDNETYSGGRGAFFGSGNIGKGFHLSVTYDSAKVASDDFFMQEETDVNGEDKFPLYGDGSRVSRDAVSKSKLYLRLEKDASSILFGDFNTDLSDSKLAAYSRTFNGVKIDAEADRVALKGFFSHSDFSQAVDALPARGISGYYFLTHSGIMPGSEKVVIETRNRWRPESMISRNHATRNIDYEIDYEAGTILFRGPIPSQDRDLNPLFIMVSYECENLDGKYSTFGGRGTFRAGRRIEIGATSILEEQPAGNYRLQGADLSLTLPHKISLRVEFAQSSSLFDIDGYLKPLKGKAMLIELEGSPMDGTQFSGYFRKADNTFNNPSAYDVFPGVDKYGLNFAHEIGTHDTLRVSFFNEKDTLNQMYYRQSVLGYDREIREGNLNFEILRESSKDSYIPLNLQNTRHPFDIAEQTPESLTALRIAMNKTLGKKITLHLEHKQNITGTPYHLSQAGMDYQITDSAKAYIRNEYARFDQTRDNRIVMGAESSLLKNTTAFSEYRMGWGTDSERLQKSIGLRNKFSLGKGVTGNLTFEKLDTLKGPELNRQPDETAISVGLEYLPKDNLKITTRLESRKGGADKSDLAEISAVYKAGEDLHLLFKERYFTNIFSSQSVRKNSSHSIFGIAFRPIRHDRFNAMAKYELKNGIDSVSVPGYDGDAIILSLQAGFRIAPDFRVSGRFAKKTLNGFGSSWATTLYSGKIVHDVTDRFDVTLEYRVMSGEGLSSELRGGTAELGFRIKNDLFLSAGYSSDKFSADLTGDDYEGKGPYMRLKFKFSESDFNKNNKNKKR
jgi:uncharacterized repeat protein (TIGR01451 family)